MSFRLSSNTLRWSYCRGNPQSIPEFCIFITQAVEHCFLLKLDDKKFEGHSRSICVCQTLILAARGKSSFQTQRHTAFVIPGSFCIFEFQVVNHSKLFSAFCGRQCIPADLARYSLIWFWCLCVYSLCMQSSTTFGSSGMNNCLCLISRT